MKQWKFVARLLVRLVPTPDCQWKNSCRSLRETNFRFFSLVLLLLRARRKLKWSYKTHTHTLACLAACLWWWYSAHCLHDDPRRGRVMLAFALLLLQCLGSAHSKCAALEAVSDCCVKVSFSSVGRCHRVGVVATSRRLRQTPEE